MTIGAGLRAPRLRWGIPLNPAPQAQLLCPSTATPATPRPLLEPPPPSPAPQRQPLFPTRHLSPVPPSRAGASWGEVNAAPSQKWCGRSRWASGPGDGQPEPWAGTGTPGHSRSPEACSRSRVSAPAQPAHSARLSRRFPCRAEAQAPGTMHPGIFGRSERHSVHTAWSSA